MLQAKAVFSGFSVDNLTAAKEFYATKLGLEIGDESMGLELVLPSGGRIFVYEKSDHQPAGFTILNFVVDDIDQAVSDLKAEGITFEHYDGLNGTEDIARGKAAGQGPDIAWFKDPAGNILAVLLN